ncbi:MAG: STT3 domain-containing protein [Candidatus Odinarchaeota archaeon]
MGWKIASFSENIRGLISFKREKFKLKSLILYISLISIFLIALFVRLTPAAYEAILKGFDPYFQFRQTQYIVENGFSAWFNWHDPFSWYPWGRDIPANSYPGLPFAAAAVYLFLTGIGLPINLLEMCWAWPAFMGALTTIAMYFLGKEFGSKKVGLIAAFFLALMPAYFQRTIAGFFDNETVGILLMVLTTYFYIRAIKRESVFSSLLSGLALAYLTITWGANIYFFYLIPLSNLIFLILKKYKPFYLIPYALTIGIPLLVGSQIPLLGGANIIFNGTGIISIGVLGILVLYELIGRFRKSPTYAKIKPYTLPIIGGIIGVIALSVIVLYFIAQINIISPIIGVVASLPARFLSIINPLARSEVYLVASVGEHAVTSWGVFYYYLFIPIFLFPVGIYFVIKRLETTDILLLTALITSLYFSASMIRLLLVLAPFICLFAAYGLVNVMKPFSSIISKETITVSLRKRRVSKTVSREYSVIAFGIVFILLAANLWHGIDVSRQFAPSEMVGLGVYYDWQESFQWMRNNIGTGRVILSWWDYGYWITAVANETTLMDNGTFNETQIAILGLALMSGEVEALKIMRQYGVEYVLVHFGYFIPSLSGDEGKWIWMVRIASDNYPEIINESQYYNATAGKPTSKFFDSLIYKLLFYKEPGSYELASYVSNSMDKLGYPKYQSYPTSQRWMFIGADSDYPVFNAAYISSHNLVKLYKVDYTILDTWLEIVNTTVYTFPDKTCALVTVRNNGSEPVTVDTSSSSILINGSKLSTVGGSAHVAEGSALMNPGETCTVKIDVNSNSTVGTAFNTTIRSVEFYGYRKSSDINIVRAAGSLSISIINATAYSNETIFLNVENTGDEYLTVTKIYVNGSSSGVNIQGDLTLAPGQVQMYTLTFNPVNYPSLNLNVSDIVNINISTWEGVSDTLTGVVVQSPPGYNFTVSEVNVFSNETVLFNMFNNGSYPLGISHIILSTGIGSVTFYRSSITALNGSLTINPGSTIRYKVAWAPSLIDLNQTDMVNITVCTYEGLEYTVQNITVTEPVGYDYTVTGQVYDNETAYLTVSNNGSYPITLRTVTANGTIVNTITPINGSMTLNPGVATLYKIVWDPFIFNVSAGEYVELKTITFQDINRTISCLVESSNYSIMIDPSITFIYSNNTIFITLNNTSPSFSINNLTILVENQTSGESQYLTWTGVLNTGESVNLSFNLDEMPSLNAGETLRVAVKSVENASYQVLETVL